MSAKPTESAKSTTFWVKVKDTTDLVAKWTAAHAEQADPSDWLDTNRGLGYIFRGPWVNHCGMGCDPTITIHLSIDETRQTWP